MYPKPCSVNLIPVTLPFETYAVALAPLPPPLAGEVAEKGVAAVVGLLGDLREAADAAAGRTAQRRVAAVVGALRRQLDSLAL